MDIEYIHFYVDDAIAWRQWFVERWGFSAAGGWRDRQSCHERVHSGAVRFLLSSALGTTGPVAAYLARHPQGVVDVALRLSDLEALEATVARAIALGAKLCQPITPLDRDPADRDLAAKHSVNRHPARSGHWAAISGWGDLRHSLIQVDPAIPIDSPRQHSADSSANWPPQFQWPDPRQRPDLQRPDLQRPNLQRIDHCVLNVAAGDLPRTVDWYGQLFGLSPQQSFHIKTAHSGLHSQVLVGEPPGPDPSHRLQLPINQPASPSSQIQEFLDHNRGPGIQHIALLTPNLLPTVAQLRAQGICFLSVPPSYYTQLRQRPKFQHQGLAQDWQHICEQQALVDWHPERDEGSLLQIFTETIFPEPTFFFELIERRRLSQAALPSGALQSGFPQSGFPQPDALQTLPADRCAQGFGEGNFQALFEAMERAQLGRAQAAEGLERP
ncbi:MAG: 4-hydroxyphenylpyruvate dioxygenase [Synechococcales cyanobacterium RM1_1_8]|nr:4-hydroxyphenylpyruvate dioxygenase [Synechococcales cyanobacterium RM1_1_8]